jgi:hypothetical protein
MDYRFQKSQSQARITGLDLGERPEISGIFEPALLNLHLSLNTNMLAEFGECIC